MTDTNERSVSISRRQFLAGVGATSAGAAAIGSAATDDPTLALGSTEPMPINERFNIDDYRIGPKSERPAASDVKGTVYEVTDGNASNGTRRTFSDGSQWVTLNVEADVIDTDEADIGPGSEHNLPVAIDLGENYGPHVIADDGTHYALYDSGGDLVLAKTDTPRVGASWSDVYTWPNGGGSMQTHDLHMTVNGTLLNGVNGNLERSTDGGQSFTATGVLNNDHIWSFSETSVGSIILVERGGTELRESTDDGQSTTVLADMTNDFTAFNTHIHKAQYHPQNDNILVTGGDTDDTFYRSEDGGTTWDEFNALLGQFVGVCPHPNDGTRWFCGHDVGTSTDTQFGIVEIVDNGGTSVQQYFRQNFNLSVPTDTAKSARGSFAIQAVEDTNTGDGYLVAGSYQGDVDESIWVSQSLNGRFWSQVAYVESTAVGVLSTTQGPYEHLDLASNDTVIGQNKAIPLDAVRDPAFGRAVSERLETLVKHNEARLWDYDRLPGQPHMRAYYSSNQLVIENMDTNTTVLTIDLNLERVLWNKALTTGSTKMRGGFGDDSSGDDLTTMSGNYSGEHKYHDGSGTPAAGPYVWDGSNWNGYGPTSGTTI